MRKLILIKLCLWLMPALFFGLSAFSQDIPARPDPPRLVNDFANALSPEQRDILEQKLVALDDSTSNQVAIVIIKTLNDYPIEDYAVKMFRSWGIGNKKTNNGVLLIAAIDDRKVRIEVGYGLEGAIPDITANNIIENDIVPSFKTQNYYGGLNAATDDLSKAAAGEYHVAKPPADDSNSSGQGGGGSLLGIIVIIIIILLISRRGGGGGGVGGFILGSMLGGGGRGGWSGGGGGFGGGGGGGFGGFGGGSSGGGGASGGW